MPVNSPHPLQGISVVVLAAGTSSRMNGKNKLLQPFRKSTVLDITLQNYISCGFQEIICVLGRNHEQTAHIAESRGVSTVYNSNFMLGMAHSLAIGVSCVSPEAKGILIVLGDMPFFQEASIYQLCKDFENDSSSFIYIPAFQGQRGNPVLFSAKYRNELTQLTGDVGAKSVVKKYAEYCIECAMQDDSCLRDIDTEEDFPEE